MIDTRGMAVVAWMRMMREPGVSQEEGSKEE
jgi:hypothetical protein